jgi:hypothetical protein
MNIRWVVVTLAAILGLLAGPASAQISPAALIATVESAATTNATPIKVGPVILYGFSLCNNTASIKVFKFYNKATAPTVGTDVVFFKVLIPANQCRDRHMTLGVLFPLGIGYAITGLAANTDTTVVAAGDVSGAFEYK